MRFRFLVAWFAVAFGVRALAAEGVSKLPDLDRASWIWNSLNAVTDGEFGCFFRKTFDLPERPVSATVLATADNGYDLFVNGSLVGGDAGFDSIYWSSVERYPIEHLLAAGRNVIALRGENMGGPAGLILAARVELAGGKAVELLTDATWRVWLETETTWTSADYDDSKWRPAAVLGPMGMAPWGKLTFPGPVSPQHAGRGGTSGFTEPDKDFRFPSAVLFIRGRVPPSSTSGAPQSVWPIGGSRAYLENDTPGPAALGRKLFSLAPAQPEGRLTLLVDAGKGLLGSPSVSYDGKTIHFSMAPEGEAFFHIYRVSSDGSGLTPLTKGTFHDFDPEPLPDGRIVFSSTRLGSREEYHGNVARSLFVMRADGTNIQPLTYHIVGDNEPKVLADGEIAFIRCDNFLERAKVETQVHVLRPDGTGGRVLFGPYRGAIAYDRANGAEADSRWLRSYGFGSVAPLPDGRVACLSFSGAVMASGDPSKPTPLQSAVNVFDLSPMPDGRLLCTTASRGSIGVLDPSTGAVTRIYSADSFDLHSAVFLGPRPRPPVLASHVNAAEEDNPNRTGYLLCQNALYTKQREADLARVKAIRVLEGVPFSVRSARHPYDHIGVETVELGTVPLAPDGSFYVRVPADRALALQAVDAEGRSVVNELTWIYVRPGETRTCIGCHASPQSAPPGRIALAARSAPMPLLGKGEAHRFRGNNAANGGVLNLQFDRFREAASINLYSHGNSRPAEVKRLCAVLRSEDRAQRIAAAQKLAILRDRSAVGSLLLALREESADLRMNAALALSACGNLQAVDGLVGSLEDSVPAVAMAAHVALENLTGHTASFNAYDDAQRKKGAEAWRLWLQRNPWDKVEEDLIARLTSRDPVIEMKAVEALGHIGAEEAKGALRAFVKEKQSADLRATLAAMRALGHLRDESAVPMLAQILKDNVGPKPGDAPANPELGWLQLPVHLAAGAAEALGWIGTPAAERALLEVYPTLQPFWYYTNRTGDHGWLMGCHSSVLHYRIAEALDAMDSTETASIVPFLLRSVPIDTDRALLFENDSYEWLVAHIVARSGRSGEVAEACLSAMGDREAAVAASAGKATPDMVAAVTASPPAESVGPLGPESRAALLASIVCLDGKHTPRLRAAFDRYRAQPPSRERSWVCFYLARALGKLRDRGSVPSLLAALNSDPTEASFGFELPPNVFIYKAMTPFYRAAAAYSLGMIGDTAAIPSLLKAVGNFDNAMDVRHGAARALAMLSAQPGEDRASLKELQSLAADYPEVSTRRILLAACAAPQG